MSAIDDLQNKVARLRDQLNDAQAKLDAALIAAHPVKVGQRFASKRRSGRSGEVTRIVTEYGRVVPVLTYSKKDGTRSQQEAFMRWMEDWEPLS